MKYGVRCETCGWARVAVADGQLSLPPDAVLAHMAVEPTHILAWPWPPIDYVNLKLPDDTPELNESELAAARGYRVGWAANDKLWRERVDKWMKALLQPLL